MILNHINSRDVGLPSGGMTIQSLGPPNDLTPRWASVLDEARGFSLSVKDFTKRCNSWRRHHLTTFFCIIILVGSRSTTFCAFSQIAEKRIPCLVFLFDTSFRIRELAGPPRFVGKSILGLLHFVAHNNHNMGLPENRIDHFTLPIKTVILGYPLVSHNICGYRSG